MPLLLTILSVLAVWAFLTVLLIGLLLILKSLDSIQSYLEKIAMGVRAIERETAPFGGRAEAVTSSLGKAGRTIGSAARRLAEVIPD